MKRCIVPMNLSMIVGIIGSELSLFRITQTCLHSPQCKNGSAHIAKQAAPQAWDATKKHIKGSNGTFSISIHRVLA